MRSETRLTVFLCLSWSIALLYGEMVVFWLPLWSFSWPRPSPLSSSDRDDQLKVAVLADPQLMDRTSLGLSPGSLALEAAQFYTDIYMKRSFRASILPFKPDLIIFLGDMFDGGPLLSDEEWKESLHRFKHIFDLGEHGRGLYTPIYYLSGNHDVGYGAFHTKYPKVISRYQNEFGARNYRFSMGNVEFIVVDSQTLDGPQHGAQTTLSWGFIREIAKDAASNSRVLLTHIPLYRPDGTPCGPFRSSPAINQSVSYDGSDHRIKYQNYLSKDTSDQLLDIIKPVLVLSGHDHDQCTLNHSTPAGSVTEHTLGTLSWQQGNLYPSFMLLSATSVASADATLPKREILTRLCFLPMQTHIYLWYLFQLAMTLLLLIIWPTNGFGFYDRLMGFFASIQESFLTTPKEKDDEENCEIEMVWDADGSMHLIKKAPMKVPLAKSDLGIAGRGNAIIRPAAKRPVAPEEEASVSVDMDADARLVENTTGKISRSSKSRPRRLIQRLFRVCRALSLIAAVNIPLYIMLLFKDWI